MRLTEVKVILRSFGYIEKRGSGTSHRRFVCPGKYPIHFPVAHGRVKKVYLVEIIRLLELEEETE